MTLSPPPPAKLRLLPSQTMLAVSQRDFFELAPDQFVAVCPPQHAPKIGVVRFMRAEGGLYQPVIEALPALVHHRQWKPDVYGCSWYTVLRLAAADFVESMRPGPRTTCIVLESYFSHLTRTREDPGFWSPENLRRFEAARVRAQDLEDEETPGQPELPFESQPPGEIEAISGGGESLQASPPRQQPKGAPNRAAAIGGNAR